MQKRVYDIIRTTNNRYVFNRAYKLHLNKVGKIRCSYCSFHEQENQGKNKSSYYIYYYTEYNSYIYRFVAKYPLEEKSRKSPNWKLCTKNRKQWMKKNLKVNKTHTSFIKHITW